MYPVNLFNIESTTRTRRIKNKYLEIDLRSLKETIFLKIGSYDYLFPSKKKKPLS